MKRTTTAPGSCPGEAQRCTKTLSARPAEMVTIVAGSLTRGICRRRGTATLLLHLAGLKTSSDPHFGYQGIRPWAGYTSDTA